jgi:hypothetical protein
MDSKKLVVIPIYWGSKWLPSTGPMRPLQPEINWINVNAAMWTIMRSWYMLGLQDYGVLPGIVHPGLIIEDSEAVPPASFTNDQDGAAWSTMYAVIDAGRVPPPDAWGNDYIPLYALMFAPGSACTNGDFGYNLSFSNLLAAPESSGVGVWVTANSDLAGAIETFAHEMVEGASGQQIADACQPATAIIDGLKLPLYQSKTVNACWPTQDALELHRGFESIDRFKDLKQSPVKVGGS